MCCNEVHKLCSPKRLVEYISENFNKTVSISWYRYFIEIHKDKIFECTAYPQESSRLQLTKEAAMKHVKILEKYVAGTPDELVFNLDEVGCQQWADRKPKHCVVPIKCKGQRVEFEVQRKEKRITVITAISMAGDVLTPLLVTHRKTIDEEVKQAGIREGEDYLIRYQENSFVTIEIFSDYINEVFLPYVEQLRQNQLYAGKTTVLLCGNCSPHIDAALLQQLAMKKVRIVTFPLHSSHLFQPLDLVIFGAYKYYLKIVTTKYERHTHTASLHQ